ncbi:transposase [Oceanobacillus rekensis]|uniref:transposase n=1 Tax=Oceanobacillus rekensis TaxID=937927 RepID=UPI002481A467|nr:transposase [Oceanobacillus rekensis]
MRETRKPKDSVKEFREEVERLRMENAYLKKMNTLVQIKHNNHFQCFSLRGLSKIRLEGALICIATNLKKWEIMNTWHT